MRASSLLVAALGASVWAAPAYPSIDPLDALPDNIRAIMDYFNLLATKVQDSRLLANPPVCDLSKVSLPPGLTLKHVAIGRGTQNYTCDTSNSTAVPQAQGAVATLFNASCLVALHQDLASALGRAALHFPLAAAQSHGSGGGGGGGVLQQLAPSNLAVSGAHYFADATTPFFDLDVSPAWQLGTIPCRKTGSAPAPADAGRGLDGEPAVAWLKLDAKPGATAGLREVYRVETVGGSPPATCKGLPASFEVQYATQYWFYASDS